MSGIAYRLTVPREDGGSIEIAEIVLDDAHMLSGPVKDCEEKAAIAALIAEINEMEQLHLPEAPKGASPLESWGRIVERGEDDFAKALEYVLEAEFGLIAERIEG